jgi:hypothetical protein
LLASERGVKSEKNKELQFAEQLFPVVVFLISQLQ